MEKFIFPPVDLIVSPQLLYLPWKLDAIINQQGDRTPDQNAPCRLNRSSPGTFLRHWSGFCIVRFLSQFVETLAIYWMKVGFLNFQKSHTRWSGRASLHIVHSFLWRHELDEMDGEKHNTTYLSCHKPLLCTGATRSQAFLSSTEYMFLLW